MRIPKPAQTIICVGILITLAGSTLLARTYVEDAKFQQTYGPVEDRELAPSARLLEPLALNYRTFAADMVWIRALLYFGEKSAETNKPERLEDYARTIAQLDPRFYDVYKWFAATYLTTRWPITHQDLEKVTDFLMLGINQFPNDAELPYSAAMNYLGYSVDREPEVRLEEIRDALELLKLAAERPNTPPMTPSVSAYLLRLHRNYSAKIDDKDEEIPEAISRRALLETYSRLYLLESNPRMREKLLARLESLGGTDYIVRETRQLRRDFETARSRRLPYLPPGLWIATVAPRNAVTDGSANFSLE